MLDTPELKVAVEEIWYVIREVGTWRESQLLESPTPSLGGCLTFKNLWWWYLWNSIEFLGQPSEALPFYGYWPKNRYS